MRSKSRSASSLTELFRPNGARRLKSRDLSHTRLDLLKKEIQTNLHMIPLRELYIELETDPTVGLTSEKAAELQAYYGLNKLTPSTQDSWPRILFKAMCTGFSILIWLGACLCILAYLIEYSSSTSSNRDNLFLGCVLIGVELVCGTFTFVQNFKSGQIMNSFNNMIPSYTRCVRDGAVSDTPVSALVKGDIVRVEAGDVVPADIRIIDSKGFKVDNSSLTGESVAVPRSNTDGTLNILESSNVAFFSTQCVEGWAVGVVICCGDLTALGRVAGLAARVQPDPSPLSREIKRFMRYVSISATTLGLIIAIASLALGYTFLETTIFVIGIIVANMPEGLQPTVTAALTLTAQHMVKRNCLVKNLDAIEALGACNTICSDKTGTLTENKMAVRTVWIWNERHNADDVQDPVFESLKMCAALCSKSTVNADGTIRGDASEIAILNFLFNCDAPLSRQARFPKVAEIPFNSANKYQASVHEDPTRSVYLVMMKGAPEIIATRSGTILTRKGEIALTAAMKTTIEEAITDLADTGERVLAFADFQLNAKTYPPGFQFDSENVNFPIAGLRFLGLLGLIDPPRKEVLSAIQRVRSAGVRVMMVTGDHPATARAIAGEVGIATGAGAHVVTGDDLRQMPPDLLEYTLLKHYEIVFARTSPTQKLQIVEACQRLGAIVAVTGDGVNDSPALRRADIGISMGITGSQVSKQTADIILMDDNFATIVIGIEEGRKIYDNLKKSICYILISNVPEIFPVLMFILFSIPLPLGVMTILCVDLGTDMWPAVALSYEPPETDVMCRPPRKKASIVPCAMMYLAYTQLGLIETAAGMFAYFVIMAEHGFYPSILFGIRARWDNEAVTDLADSLGQEWTYGERKKLQRAAQAGYFVSVVIMQVVNGCVAKTRYNSIFHVGMNNRALSMGMVFEVALAIFLCYTPIINDFFQTYPLKPEWWCLALPFCLFLFCYEEFRKHCIRGERFNGWYNKHTLY